MVPADAILDSKWHWFAMPSPVSWLLFERISRTALAFSSVPFFEAVFSLPPFGWKTLSINLCEKHLDYCRVRLNKPEMNCPRGKKWKNNQLNLNTKFVILISKCQLVGRIGTGPEKSPWLNPRFLGGNIRPSPHSAPPRLCARATGAIQLLP